MFVSTSPSPRAGYMKSVPCRIKGIVLMELILAGLAGLGALALLLQQKPVPSKEDAEKAFDKLDKEPLDPDANTIFGKWKAFAMGDYAGAMPYLVHSKDATLKSLATHELDETQLVTGAQKVAMGDEWVNGAKKHPALNKIFYERAAQWYTKAWPDLEGAAKQKLRDQAKKLAASRPPGAGRKGLPTGWIDTASMDGFPPVLDGTIARTGSVSAKILPPLEKAKVGSASIAKTEMLPIQPKPVEMIAYTLSDGTDNGTDRVAIGFYDAGGNSLAYHQAFLPNDLPFWTPVTIKAVPPANAARADVQFWQYSKKGNIWIDDVSLKVDGKEAVKNGSFEER